LDNQPGNRKRKKYMNWGERLLFMGFFVGIGLLALGFNLRAMFKYDWYYPMISYLGGIAIASGVIFGFFKDTKYEEGKFGNLLVVSLIIIAFSIGAIFNLVFAGQIY
jgi:hypothetical protein